MTLILPRPVPIAFPSAIEPDALLALAMQRIEGGLTLEAFSYIRRARPLGNPVCQGAPLADHAGDSHLFALGGVTFLINR